MRRKNERRDKKWSYSDTVCVLDTNQQQKAAEALIVISVTLFVFIASTCYCVVFSSVCCQDKR